MAAAKKKPAKRVQRDASLHPSTVSNAHKHIKRRKSATRQPKSEVITVVPNPIIWDAVLRLSNKDFSRVQIIHQEEVIIWNDSKWRKK